MWYLILCLRGLDISFFLSVFHTGLPSHPRMISISSLGADSSFYLTCLPFLPGSADGVWRTNIGCIATENARSSRSGLSCQFIHLSSLGNCDWTSISVRSHTAMLVWSHWAHTMGRHDTRYGQIGVTVPGYPLLIFLFLVLLFSFISVFWCPDCILKWCMKWLRRSFIFFLLHLYDMFPNLSPPPITIRWAIST